MTENVVLSSPKYVYATSPSHTAEKKKVQNQIEFKDANGNIRTLKRKISDCEEHQLQIMENFTLDNHNQYNRFPSQFSKIEEADEEEEGNQCQSEDKGYYESDSDEEARTVHTYMSNANTNLIDNSSLSLNYQKSNSYENTDFFKDVKKHKKKLSKNQQDDDKDESDYIIRNLDTGEVIDLRQTDSNDKLDYSYCSLITKPSTPKPEDITQLNCMDVNFLQENQNWDSFWIKVKKNNNLLIDYCENGDIEKLKYLLDTSQKIPTQVNFKSIDDWTALHFASSMGHHQIVSILLQCGGDPYSQSSMLRTPLHSAVLSGNLKCVVYLVEKGKQKLLDMQDKDFNTVLHLATENDQLQIVECFLQNGANHLIKNHKNFSPYQLCISQEMKQLYQDYQATETNQDQCYSRFSVGGLVKRNSRADHVSKILQMAQSVQKCVEQRKIQIIQEKQKLIKEMSWRDFRFINKLGQGSFGEVYLVEKDKKLYAMKIQSKQQVIQKNLQRYVQTEKKALSLFNHPFIIKLHFAFQNESYLFMVMEYAQGGDMGNYLNKRNKLPENEARIYTAQIILALEELHKQDIIFRDLKPDNVVLDRQGNAKLTDFGLSKEGIKENTFTKSFCGSIAYLAPEVLTKRPHSRTVDWYLLGTFLYELLVGIPPYYDNNREVLYENIKKGPLKIPKSMTFEAKDLIKQLLNRNPKERLGSRSDAQEIKVHPFFKDINWEDVQKGKVKLPSIDIPYLDTKTTLSVNFDPKSQFAHPNKGGNFNQQTQPQKHGRIEQWSYIN